MQVMDRKSVHVIVKPAPAVESGLLMSNSVIIDLSWSMILLARIIPLGFNLLISMCTIKVPGGLMITPSGTVAFFGSKLSLSAAIYHQQKGL